MKTAIVVVAFNRPNSLIKLLSSLEKAFYTEVVKIANDFVWSYGDKIIIDHKKNLGLKKHILSCGDLTDKYDSVIILEDDSNQNHLQSLLLQYD